MSYLGHLKEVAEDDVAALKKAEKSYGDSWKKRGGVGAFMMLARKWDRIEKQLSESHDKVYDEQTDERGNTFGVGVTIPAYDILAAVEHSEEDGIMDDVRDLRRYLLLIEAEVRGVRNLPQVDP